jgi:hypothetical protein
VNWTTLLATIVVPTVSVVSTAVAAIWSKIIDAKTKREDRQHARSLDYEGRVWQAKNDALRRLISACRLVKRKAQTAEQERGTGEDKLYWRVRLIEALANFKREIGDEEGISEITAYAAEPVCESLDALLGLIEERLRPHQVALFRLRRSRHQLELPVTDSIDSQEEHATLQETLSKAMAELMTVDIDVDAVVKLCDRIIDVARQDLQGRY